MLYALININIYSHKYSYKSKPCRRRQSAADKIVSS